MPWLNLRNPLKRRLQAQSITSSPSPLPPEVWELVLEELTDEGLLAAARVCSAFNDRCISIHLGRNGITHGSLSSGTLNIHSHLLAVLQLSRLTPQIRTLVCHFWAFNVLRDIRFLREFIIRSPKITELRVSFADNLIDAHTVDTLFPYSQHALLTEFCNVVRAMVATTTAPIFVIISRFIDRVRLRDLADWGLRHSLYWRGLNLVGHAVWIGAVRAMLRAKRTHPRLFLPVWTGGTRQRREYTRHLRSVEVHAVPATSEESGPFTLIVFEADTAKSLDLGRSWISGEAAIPDAQLTRIISLITLPSLRTLWINQDVDPAILLQFMCRHPTIRSIRYTVKGPEGLPAFDSSTDELEKQQARRLLTSAPLALPALSYLACRETAHTSVLLDTFGLSPQLSSIDIGFERFSFLQVTSLKRALRRLSLHPAVITFHLSTLYKTGEHWPIDDEERRIVGCLYSLRSICISAREMAEVQPLIPWLAMLPALASIEVSVYSWVASASATASALEEMRAALPWVPEIEVIII
ncbi:hypothetical protein FB451DRAFT_1564817 [Mycena latifolia]|nr:hypothetical protein FB451DRAFT_1564817 [Mycena latifolia]